MRFTNKTALITGGNSGIGFATAKLLIAEGARVAITDETAPDWTKPPPDSAREVLAIQADLDDPDAIDAMIEATGDAFGSLDIVFANAGILAPTPLGNTTAAAFEAILRTNLTAVFLTVQACAAADEARRLDQSSTDRSCVSWAGPVRLRIRVQGGHHRMAKVLAAELVPRGIRVNTVIPGATRTPIWTRDARAGASIDDAEKAIAPGIPMGPSDRCGRSRSSGAVPSRRTPPRGMTAAEIVVDGGTTGAPSGAPVYRRDPA